MDTWGQGRYGCSQFSKTIVTVSRYQHQRRTYRFALTVSLRDIFRHLGYNSFTPAAIYVPNMRSVLVWRAAQWYNEK